MIIALDYDETFTKDAIYWGEAVARAKERGHSVTFVTSRHDVWDNADIEADARRLAIDIVYCNMKPKAACFNADVWIDDCPEAIPDSDIFNKLFEIRKREYERLIGLKEAIIDWKRVVFLGAGHEDVAPAWANVLELLKLLEETDSDKEKI